MSKRDNLVGQRFGALLVVDSLPLAHGKAGKIHFMQKCQCDCGTIRMVRGYDLKAGRTKSCGCERGKNVSKAAGDNIQLVGMKFGRLTVTRQLDLRLVGDTTAHGRRFWKCVCECGKQVEKHTSDLTTGNVRSCGCLLKDTLTTATVYSEVNRMRVKILQNGRTITLTDDEVVAIITKDCHYCGAAPSKNSRYAAVHRNGMDRVDNSKDYTLDNVVPCCKFCNVAKNNNTQQDFLTHIKSIYFHSIHKG